MLTHNAYNSFWTFNQSSNYCFFSNECANGAGKSGVICQASSHTTESVYSLSFNKTTGAITIYNGYCNKTITTEALTTSKITSIDFDFQNSWYNTQYQTYIDYIKIN